MKLENNILTYPHPDPLPAMKVTNCQELSPCRDLWPETVRECTRAGDFEAPDRWERSL